MLNPALMRPWQNWLIVFLMIAIGLTGSHIFLEYLDSDNG
jgi:uncharacterized membrane protein YwzB